MKNTVNAKEIVVELKLSGYSTQYVLQAIGKIFKNHRFNSRVIYFFSITVFKQFYNLF